jgi:hypothetical protein
MIEIVALAWKRASLKRRLQRLADRCIDFLGLGPVPSCVTFSRCGIFPLLLERRRRWNAAMRLLGYTVSYALPPDKAQHGVGNKVTYDRNKMMGRGMRSGSHGVTAEPGG